MIEKGFYSTAGTDRGLGDEITRDEPSHIHLPRRRRPARPADQGERTIWSDEERRGPAYPSVQEA